MPRNRRAFAMVEIYLWNDPVFRALPEDARWLWVHLMLSPRTTKLPGLIKASPIIVMADLQWDKPPDGELNWPEEEVLTRGVQRTTRAFAALEKTRHRTGTPWVIVDRQNNLIVLPRRVARLLPDNSNMVVGWIDYLKEVPPSTGRDAWIVNAYRILREALGKDDKRTALLVDEYKIAAHRYAETSGTTTEPETVQETLPGTVPETVPETVQKNRGNGSAPILDLRSLDSRSEILDREKGIGRGRAPSPSRRRPDEKDKEPPQGASPRLCAIYHAMQTEEFNVPGVGDQTMWDNITKPRKIAEKLDRGAPAIDVPLLIRKLAGWTYAKPRNAKKSLGQFVWNAAQRDQDKPKPTGHHGNDYAHGSDLEAKVNAAKRGGRH